MHYLYKICSSKFFKPITLAVLLTTFLGFGMLLDVQAVHAQTKITVTKDAENAGTQKFRFVENTSGSNIDHFIMDGESFTLNVLSGTYFIQEPYIDDWVRTAMTCDGGEITYNYDGGFTSGVFTPGYAQGMNITVPLGQPDINCTFTNRLHPDYPHGGVTIKKECDGGMADASFDFTASNGVPGNLFSLQCDKTRTIDYLPTGVPLEFREVGLAADWSLETVACVNTFVPGIPSGTTVIDNLLTVFLTPGEDITCTFTNKEDDTAITLASLDAAANPNGTTVTWTTAAEIDNAGFNVYGGSTAAGPWTKLNADLISAEGGLAESASYQFADTSDAAFYMLEDVDTSGVTTRHGPVSVGSGTTDASAKSFFLFLPLLQRPL